MWWSGTTILSLRVTWEPVSQSKTRGTSSTYHQFTTELIYRDRQLLHLWIIQRHQLICVTLDYVKIPEDLGRNMQTHRGGFTARQPPQHWLIYMVRVTEAERNTNTFQWRCQKAVWWFSVCSQCTAKSTGPSSGDIKCSKRHLPQLCLQHKQKNKYKKRQNKYLPSQKCEQRETLYTNIIGRKWTRLVFNHSVTVFCSQVVITCYCM